MRLFLLLLLGGQMLAQNASWNNLGPGHRLETAAKLCTDPSGNIFLLANEAVSQLPGNKWQIYKLDPNGNVIWQKVYGSVGNYSASQIIHFDQKLFVCGDRVWNDTGRAWVAVLDTSGALLNEKHFGSGDTVLVGQDIAINANEEIALLNQIVVQTGTPQGAQVLILDTALNIYQRHLNTDTTDFVAHEIVDIPTGGWVYVSDYELPNRFDVLVTKIDNQGNQLKQTIVSNGHTRGGNAIGLNSKGQIAIGGEGASAFSVSFDVTLSLLDSNLNVLADVYVRPGVPLNDACFDMAITPDDTYLFTGYHIAPENGLTEMIVVESDSAGQRIFIDSYASSPTCIGSGIICDNQGKWIAAGSDFNKAPSLIVSIGNAKGLNLDQHHTPSVSLFPNPNNGTLQLIGLDQEDEVKVLDMQGRAIPFELSGDQLKIDAGSGTYLLKVNDQVVERVVIH